MRTTGDTLSTRKTYHRDAFEFVFDALKYTQELLNRDCHIEGMTEDSAHISGKELLEGIRLLALERYGLMTLLVFHSWGIHATDDFGQMVFELIERGEMKKTERDQLSDFVNVYNFQEEFHDNYKINLNEAFKSTR